MGATLRIEGGRADGARLPTAEELPYSDGDVMESQWHRDVMYILIDIVNQHFRDRSDQYCGGDMFIYFSTELAKNRDFRGPDFYYVKGVPKRTRLSWVAWEEGWRFPNVIVEAISESTRDKDLGEKKRIYEKVFRTPEYFVVEPDRETLYGWRLTNGMYRKIKPENGRLWCEQLELYLGFWEGEYLTYLDTYPRFFQPDGQLVFTFGEAERANADAERANAATTLQKLAESKATNEALLVELEALKAKLALQSP